MLMIIGVGGITLNLISKNIPWSVCERVKDLFATFQILNRINTRRYMILSRQLDGFNSVVYFKNYFKCKKPRNSQSMPTLSF